MTHHSHCDMYWLGRIAGCMKDENMLMRIAANMWQDIG